MKDIYNRLKGFLYRIYLKLFKINDTPQKVALGLGIGVFCGIMPGVGPLIALFAAFLLRANRASALIGTLLTNTWLSVVTFVLSIRIGSAILNTDWRLVYKEALLFVKDFHWAGLFKLSLLRIALPIALGYLAVALALGIGTYLTALLILNLRKARHDH